MKSWFVRYFRGWRLDRNPLRRPSDRAATVIGIWLIVVFAVIAPFIARSTFTWTRTLAEHARVTALASRSEITAITLEQAPAGGTLLTARRWVSASWTAPDGRQRTGPIEVPASTQKGTSERIWVTSDGDVVAPPLSAAGVAGLAERAAFGAIVVLTGLFLIAGTVIGRVIDRRRLAAWDADWAVTGPRWTRQRGRGA